MIELLSSLHFITGMTCSETSPLDARDIISLGRNIIFFPLEAIRFPVVETTAICTPASIVTCIGPNSLFHDRKFYPDAFGRGNI